MSDLKPCPFCGGKDVEIRDLKLGIYAINLGVYAVCRRCGASIKSSHSIVDVIAAWNRRPVAKELAVNVVIDKDQMKRMCDEAVSTIIDCVELLAVADECDAAGMDTDWAARIRKAVGE